MLVSMRLARKNAVPEEVALLYEFLNSTDLRTYVEKGVQHVRSDELETVAQLENWLRERGLLQRGEVATPADLRKALGLRDALRAFLQLPPASRTTARHRAECFNAASAFYPLVVKATAAGALELQPAAGANGLGRVLAEMLTLAENRRLARLKICGSDECQWVFFDRSKPGNRRWCSSLLCGNRQKTRAYRKRVRREALEVQAR